MKALNYSMEHHDKNCLTLACGELHSVQELHEALQTVLGLPEHYGKTFDALYDCLTELGQPTTLEIQNLSTASLGKAGRILQRVLLDAVENNPSFSVVFTEIP